MLQLSRDDVTDGPGRSGDSGSQDPKVDATATTSCDLNVRDPPTISDNEELLTDLLGIIEEDQRRDLST